jgi:hypothetical protein
MSSFLTASHPTRGTLWAAIDADARHLRGEVAERRFSAFLRPFRNEEEGAAALTAAGGKLGKPTAATVLSERKGAPGMSTLQVASRTDCGKILPLPTARIRRFVAVQMVQPEQWRAAVFIGWHADPSVRPDRCVATYAEAASRAAKGARKTGLPLISDRCSVLGRGVWAVPDRVSAQ